MATESEWERGLGGPTCIPHHLLTVRLSISSQMGLLTCCSSTAVARPMGSVTALEVCTRGCGSHVIKLGRAGKVSSRSSARNSCHSSFHPPNQITVIAFSAIAPIRPHPLPSRGLTLSMSLLLYFSPHGLLYIGLFFFFFFLATLN